MTICPRCGRGENKGKQEAQKEIQEKVKKLKNPYELSDNRFGTFEMILLKIQKEIFGGGK